MHHYLLCGLKVESDLAFPELTPWPGPEDQPFDIEFRLDRVDPLPDPDTVAQNFQAQGTDKLVFQINRRGRLLVEGGRRLTFDVSDDSSPERIRLNFIGIVQAILWHQRGYLPLHASTVLLGDRAIALGGPTRSGKSVLTAALTAQRCPLVADDFTIVDWSAAEPVVLPGYQKLRLWKDACEHLGLLGAAVAKAHPVFDKYVVTPERTFLGAPPQLSDIFILAEQWGQAFSAERLGPIEAVKSVLALVHTYEEAKALGRQSQIFSAINAILSNVRVWRVVAPDGLHRSADTATAILEHVSAPR